MTTHLEGDPNALDKDRTPPRTVPPSLVDLYGGSGATYTHAMNRMVAAGLRRGYHLTVQEARCPTPTPLGGP